MSSTWMVTTSNLASKLDIQLVLFPEYPCVGLCMECGDGRMVADLLRHHTILASVVDQFICLPQQRVEWLAMPARKGNN